MSLNSTPVANRTHIGIFGKRNVGKSSLINALTGQSLAIVSDIAGTTTDPVSKAMEILPLGPVVIFDTAGIDDGDELGKMRVDKSLSVLNKVDIAIYVMVSGKLPDDDDLAVMEMIKQRGVLMIVVYNKTDLASVSNIDNNAVYVSTATGSGIDELKKHICSAMPDEEKRCLISDIISPNDVIILVIPIDESAPKGRIILPQQQVLREALDIGAIATCVRDSELDAALKSMVKPPRLVITDSQAFGKVKQIVPEIVPLTSFSILMAKFKGTLNDAVNGAKALENLKDGDVVLISEGCTHHRQCADIGTVKLPNWIRNYTGKKLEFKFTSGGEFPADLSEFSLVVHCGGCMLNEREMRYRTALAKSQSIPMTNYGILISYINGILSRAIAPLK